MGSILLRIAHRKTSLEVDGEQFYRTEFCRGGRPDLRVSVYEVEDDKRSLCRIVAEHHAVAPDRERPSTKHHFNVTGLEPRPAIPSSDTAGAFEFLKSTHREIVFKTEQELRDFAVRLRAELVGRMRTVEKADVRKFLAERLRENDPEWREFFRTVPKWREWVAPLASS